MDKTKWGKNKKIIVFSLFAVLIAAVLFYFLRPQSPTGEPVGGEVYPPDLDNGYTVYIEADHEYSASTYTGLSEDPHDIREVTDELLKKEMADLCLQIEQCRKFMLVDRSCLGVSINEFVDPYYNYESLKIPYRYRYGFRMASGETEIQIYILAGDICYKLLPVEAESAISKLLYEMNLEAVAEYDSDEPIESDYIYLDDMTLPIDEPLFRFCRIDMTERPEDMTELDYILSVYDYQDMFTDATQQEYGWISTMPQESFDELMDIVEGLDNSNSAVAATVEDGRIAG